MPKILFFSDHSIIMTTIGICSNFFPSKISHRHLLSILRTMYSSQDLVSYRDPYFPVDSWRMSDSCAVQHFLYTRWLFMHASVFVYKRRCVHGKTEHTHWILDGAWIGHTPAINRKRRISVVQKGSTTSSLKSAWGSTVAINIASQTPHADFNETRGSPTPLLPAAVQLLLSSFLLFSRYILYTGHSLVSLPPPPLSQRVQEAD